MTTISVIIPTHNRPESLARTIDADLRSQFANALQSKFVITTNETAINEVF